MTKQLINNGHNLITTFPLAIPLLLFSLHDEALSFLDDVPLLSPHDDVDLLSLHDVVLLFSLHDEVPLFAPRDDFPRVLICE